MGDAEEVILHLVTAPFFSQWWETVGTKGQLACPFQLEMPAALIAQAKAESMLLLTHDKLLALYDEPLVAVV